jgi:2'-5' RNA ligase
MLTLCANDNGQGQPARPLIGDGAYGRQGYPARRRRSVPVDPVFLALYPDAIAAQSIARLAFYLRDKHRLTGWPLGQHRSHITLRGFGEYADLSDDTIRLIGDAAMSTGMPAFLIALDYVERFRNGAVVLRGDDGMAGIAMFHDALNRALQERGVPHASRAPYHPHLTLLYDAARVPTQAVEDIRWTVRECVLVHSPRGGSRHIPIARWPLAMRLAPGGAARVSGSASRCPR